MNSKEALQIIRSYHNELIYNSDYSYIEIENIFKQELKIIEKDLEILEEYRKIEEELGIELTVLFSALKNGVYYFSYDRQLMHDYVILTNNYIDVGAHDKLSYLFMTFLEKRTLLFTDYSKTWALTKEELEGNKNGN